MPQNPGPIPEPSCNLDRDPVLVALDAARERWLSSRDATGVRLLLLDALKGLEG